MTAILRNPYYFTGAIIARLAVTGATLIWSFVVLISPAGLEGTSYGAYIVSLAPARLWAVGFLAVAGIMLYRVVHKCKPHPAGAIGYILLFAAWGFVEVVLLLVARPLQPTAIATVTVITALAAYAFIANPRARDVDA